jgi:hypothetical protein
LAVILGIVGPTVAGWFLVLRPWLRCRRLRRWVAGHPPIITDFERQVYDLAVQIGNALQPAVEDMQKILNDVGAAITEAFTPRQ